MLAENSCFCNVIVDLVAILTMDADLVAESCISGVHFTVFPWFLCVSCYLCLPTAFRYCSGVTIIEACNLGTFGF